MEAEEPLHIIGRKHARPAFSEGLGMFMFVLTIALASKNAGPMAPLAIGFMLGTLVFAFGYISGGHFNPAVTFGIFLIKKIERKKALLYVASQILGGFLGALFAYAIIDDQKAFGAPWPNPAGTDHGSYAFRAFLSEFVYTFVLVSVVLNVACSHQKDNDFYGIAIGFTVTSAAWSVGGISGGSFNPSVATGLQLVKCFFSDCQPLAWIWIYWLAPLLGGAVAAFMFKICSTGAEKNREDDSPKRQKKDGTSSAFTLGTNLGEDVASAAQLEQQMN